MFSECDDNNLLIDSTDSTGLPSKHTNLSAGIPLKHIEAGKGKGTLVYMTFFVGLLRTCNVFELFSTKGVNHILAEPLGVTG